MTPLEHSQRRMEGYASRLQSGLLSIQEVAPTVLDLLAESTDRAQLWSGAPAALRDQVMEFLKRTGPDGLPPVFTIGPSDPAWREARAARRREVAVQLLAQAV